MADTTIRTRNTPSRLALPAICLGYFMVILDATAVNLSLPALGEDLGGGVGALQWVIDGYTLTFAALLLSAGSLGDRFGAHPAFLRRPGHVRRWPRPPVASRPASVPLSPRAWSRGRRPPSSSPPRWPSWARPTATPGRVRAPSGSGAASRGSPRHSGR